MGNAKADAPVVAEKFRERLHGILEFR